MLIFFSFMTTSTYPRYLPVDGFVRYAFITGHRVVVNTDQTAVSGHRKLFWHGLLAGIFYNQRDRHS